MNMNKQVLRIPFWMAIVCLAWAAAGCGEPPAPPPAPVVASSSTPPPFQYKTRVGTPVTMQQDPALIRNLVAQRSFGARPDPFALLGTEQNFNQSQMAERVLGEIGGFATMCEPPVEVADQGDIVEPQPYRRLAGILVGDTVSAIIIMEDGSAHIIKPGMRIPNSPWRVVSIDDEKAVLRRAGTQKPTQITIRLETPPGGVPVQGGGGRPGGPAGPGGGNDIGGAPSPAGGGKGGIG